MVCLIQQPTLDDDTEIPLLRVDQDKINEFARLNNQRTRLQEEYQKLKVCIFDLRMRW